MASSDHLNDEEIKLEILRIVKETGTEYQKKDPLPICDIYYKWVKSRTIQKGKPKNPTDHKE